jgi:excisionase family DNA binding protein|tara:strand:- start:1472 stop:1675 length:204 start_codon:yes stop_codon:yes gene_type:complete
MENNRNIQLLTTEQVRDILALKRTRDVLMLIKTGELPAQQLSARQYRVKQVDLEKYIDSKMYQVATI